jgi:phage terminase large subunit
MKKYKKSSGQILLTWQPKQSELRKLVDSRDGATWIGFGGARGAAKSFALLMLMIYRRNKYPGTKGLIFRRKFKDLWDNHISVMFHHWPITRAWYNTQNKELTLPTEPPSIVKFGYAEHEGDIKDFQGQGYMDIFVDEASHLTQKELEFLKTCNRWPGLGERDCKMVLAMNPGGVGHSFIKRIFFDRQFVTNEDSTNYAFIQAYGWDNIEWVRAALDAELHIAPDSYNIGQAKPNLSYYDRSWVRYYEHFDDKTRFEWFVTRSDYGRTLSNLPESMRIGHLLGRWDVFAGQYFDIFDTSVHTLPWRDIDLPSWSSRWISIDWGFAHPAAVYWFAQLDGKTITYREFLTRGIGPKDLAAQIIGKSSNEAPDAIFLSPDAFAKRTDADTIAEQLNYIFAEHGWPDCSPADNDRVGGWALMYDMLKTGAWKISDQCTNLIDMLPNLTRDDKKMEDCVKFNASEGKFDGDDACDSARYGLKSRVASHNKPVDVKINEVINEWKTSGILTDPTSEMIRRRMLQEQYKSQAKPIKIRPRSRFFHMFGTR